MYLKETWARERPDLNPSDYLFLIHVMRLGQLIDRIHDRFTRKTLGMSGADLRILLMLRRSQSTHAPKPAELAEVQMVTTGAITKQLDRLESMGLVERRPNSSEGGGISIFATDKGLELADQAMSTMVGRSPLGDMQRSLSQRDRDRLALLCEGLLVKFENS